MQTFQSSFSQWYPARVDGEILPLPIAISPRLAKLERVFVGRPEMPPREFQWELRRDFTANGGRRWMSDRYFGGYRERVRRLGGRVDVAPAVAAR